jgi:metal-sulfur cluster biosynthetic enzyme
MTEPVGAAPQQADAPVSPFPYEGPEELRQPILDALCRVVDPEVAMHIVDVGLVYGVTVSEGMLHVQVTMTSAACPVADVIVQDIERELEAAVPGNLLVHVELVWFPPWTPDRMSLSAKRFMGW